MRAPARVAGSTASAGGDEIRRALIGQHPLREAQALVIERVESGRNTLAVMGTGRGKSFCFQYPARHCARSNAAAKTLVIYPLRALANDQFEAMERRLGPLWAYASFAPTARSTARNGPSLMAALESGEWDIVCSTPEFVQYHRRAVRARD